MYYDRTSFVPSLPYRSVFLLAQSVVAQFEEGHGGVVELGPETQHFVVNCMRRRPRYIFEGGTELDLSVLPDVGVVYFGHEPDYRRTKGVILGDMYIYFERSSLVRGSLRSLDPSLQVEYVAGVWQ